MQWYDSMCRHQAKQVPSPDGVYAMVPNGATRAYLLFSYYLYTLRQHSALQKSIIERLKHKDQFQGARHELFAAATCIRAGYTIEFEDESDRSQKHSEFVATHRHTKQSICVEAQSRHRQGVLGVPGTRSPDDEVRVRVRGLLNSALKKPASRPFVIFLDLNLPPSSPVPLTQEWFQKIGEPILRDREKEGANDPWNLLVFSNFPDHYVNDEQPAPSGYAVGLVGRNPRVAAAHQEGENLGAAAIEPSPDGGAGRENESRWTASRRASRRSAIIVLQQPTQPRATPHLSLLAGGRLT